ncbi:MAG: hypothetical protein ACTSUE_06560 [Promethearchaeota archaeon]
MHMRHEPYDAVQARDEYHECRNDAFSRTITGFLQVCHCRSLKAFVP